ncbi:helix-turn-helix transcriptional regulator [Streptomyces chattanoogensis]|uniref:helix-turn-helix transcriptional regulator n=1 Tax=Streptomyces chattanoogensis TaxID=66876 RepID=UPI0006B4EECE|nr:LuxR C-terminal-related transcriptional regulator [Streptomyces chattanoogensis]
MSRYEKYRELLVQPTERLAEGARGLVLVDPAGKESFDWEAGACLSVTLPSGMIHRYYLRGDSTDRLRNRVGVLQKPSGHTAAEAERAVGCGNGKEDTSQATGGTANDAGPEAAAAAATARETGWASLTSREMEILEHVARALSNRQIGKLLSISEGTVKRHLRNIFTKLDARSRMDAVNKALPQPAPRAS